MVVTEGFAAGRQWLEDHPEEIASGYAPSKEVIIVWTVWKSLALAARGIRINCTLPGPTDTPMMPDFEEQMGKEFMDNYPIPLGHRQTPDEQAAPSGVPQLSGGVGHHRGEHPHRRWHHVGAVGGHPRRVRLRVLIKVNRNTPAAKASPQTGTPSAGLPQAFTLEELGKGRYSATSIGDPGTRDVVYGGQLLSQMILASDRVAETKDVASIHTIFARSATVTLPIELDVEVIHDGRSMGSHSVIAHQGDRVCAQALVLRRAEGPDLIRHQPTMPEVDGPDRSPAMGQIGLVAPGSELRVVDGVDTSDPESPVGPAELFVWVRLPAVTDDPVMAQALLAYGTDGFLIGTAMRPHPGLGQNMAHRAIATGVVSHTLTFHEPVPLGSWLLMAHEGAWAGRGPPTACSRIR